MTASKPPPRVVEQQEERKVQSFLERAASIVLGCRVLDADNCRALSELAAQLELSQEQLRSTLEDLRARGVIDEFALPAADRSTVEDEDTAGEASGSSRGSSASELADREVPRPPARPSADSSSARPPEVEIKPPPRTQAADEEAKLQEFLERAAPLILNRRVLRASDYQALATVAAELELSHEQLHGTLEDLRQRGVIERLEPGLPQPPPLPRQRSAANPSSASTAGAEATPPVREEEQFALTAPAPPPRKTG